MAALAAAAPPALAAVPVPLLVHDRDERDPATSVAAAPASVPGRDPRGGPVAYRRTAGRWVQYWLFFADNTQDRGIVRTGTPRG